MGKISLHDELRDIFFEQGNRWRTTTELADEVNARGRYKKKDGSPITRFQIHGRARRYEDIFERDGSRVRLRTA